MYQASHRPGGIVSSVRPGRAARTPVRIPERVVHAVGGAGYGYVERTSDAAAQFDHEYRIGYRREQA
jgi:hypothetical protein